MSTSTATAIADLSNSPVNLMVKLFDATHMMTADSLPYAGAIAGVTIVVRSALFPLAVKSKINASRMSHMKPELDVLKERMTKIQDSGNVTQEQQLKMAAQMKALFSKYKCNPLKGFLLPLLQFPIFMSAFFALQKLPVLVPDQLSTGGALWFTDLTVADPYMAMPIISAASFYLMIEMTKEDMQATEHGPMFVNIMRGISVLMVPMTMNFPAATFVYWVTNNSFSLMQTAIFKIPAFKTFVGIWDPPKPVPGVTPPKSMGLIDQVKNTINKQETKKIQPPSAADLDYTAPPPDPMRRVGTKKERKQRNKMRRTYSR